MFFLELIKNVYEVAWLALVLPIDSIEAGSAEAIGEKELSFVSVLKNR
jgi:hypothetical protein